MVSRNDEILELLKSIPDPEIPVLSILDLGIVRGVEQDENGFVVKITPTYSGCPATDFIQRSIRSALDDAGHSDVRLEVTLSPAWTTDWMTPEGKEKLRQYGITPPGLKSDEELVEFPRKALCPYCSGKETELRSEFGSTPCKSFYYCRSCQQPFERFKAI